MFCFLEERCLSRSKISVSYPTLVIPEQYILVVPKETKHIEEDLCITVCTLKKKLYMGALNLLKEGRKTTVSISRGRCVTSLRPLPDHPDYCDSRTRWSDWTSHHVIYRVRVSNIPTAGIITRDHNQIEFNRSGQNLSKFAYSGTHALQGV